MFLRKLRILILIYCYFGKSAKAEFSGNWTFENNKKNFKMNFMFIKASLIACPVGFLRINSGCYSFNIMPNKINAISARSLCQNVIPNNTNISTHLIAFETLAETIALSFWMKGLFEKSTSFLFSNY